MSAEQSVGCTVMVLLVVVGLLIGTLAGMSIMWLVS